MAFTPKHQRGGKPLPPVSTAQHGTRTGFFYGCRCDACKRAEAEYARTRREAIKAGAWEGRAITTTTKQEARA